MEEDITKIELDTLKLETTHLYDTADLLNDYLLCYENGTEDIICKEYRKIVENRTGKTIRELFQTDYKGLINAMVRRKLLSFSDYELILGLKEI